MTPMQTNMWAYVFTIALITNGNMKNFVLLIVLMDYMGIMKLVFALHL